MGRLIWSLADPQLDALGRVGLGAIALALDAAAAMGHKLAPLHGAVSATELTLSWPDDLADQQALTPLIRWAWQARGAPTGQPPEEGLGVLYLPGIHRADDRDNLTERLVEHSGILSTFLQHPRTQRKSKLRVAEARIEDRVLPLKYVEPVTEIAYVREFLAGLFRRQSLRTGRVEFSSFLRPGATTRYPGEGSWTGTVQEAIPLLFAPTACFYLHLGGADWAIITPDPVNLQEFVRVRPLVSLSNRAMLAASAVDAGFRVLLAMRAHAPIRALKRRDAAALECQVMRVGKVPWNRQNVRNRSLRMRPTEEALSAFECVERHLPNEIIDRKVEAGVFVRVPSPRAAIAENLASGRYWYCDLLDVPHALRQQLDQSRQKGESPERIWFRWIRYYQEQLTKLATDLETTMREDSSDIDSVFQDAFHAALRSLYGREAEQAHRGSRSVLDRLDDRTEQIRRALARSQTRHHLRATLAEIFAECRTKPATPSPCTGGVAVHRSPHRLEKGTRSRASLPRHVFALRPGPRRPHRSGDTGTMTMHLFGAVLTPEGVAANNRGENAGNVSTLQKLLRRGETFTTVSAEAIRYALREHWTAAGHRLNRNVNTDGETSWVDASFESWPENLNDDVLGFMHPKEDTTKRRGRLELSRAISTRPWTGDVVFNVASPGAHPRINENPIPYSVEVHCTRYQYVFGLTPAALHEPKRAFTVLEGLQNVHRVAGNHSRFLYQFAPDAVVLRWTSDPVPRMMYCFEEDEDGTISMGKLLEGLKSSDIDGSEVVVGGQPVVHHAEEFRAAGAHVYEGVKAAFSEVRQRMEATL